ncbi:MAG: acyl-ACP--UDP-N-acetylglucosamine O-acyltransferase [Oryzomonas sp.]|uniref:acyl-ACP--UDP-N-acetylglucosamine O-acyltransferase n=1 Tax=Oryzomonas sp. TaxID=2855186 RepID=UPI00283B2714|nr:acyl-ACP--UDP-N-acetylglucosamine O-acyltransferase [Oryzomonas sp.]MDR3580682.1 acyl-ACP--UDP-N-acetylglucosamine O-acyltransferase [Oryzomonas sp.]
MPDIHPLSVVHEQARLADDVVVGPFCTIGPEVTIGSGTRLISHVAMDGRTTIGERNTFFPASVIGFVPQDLKYKGEPTQLCVGNDNTIREGVTLNLGTVQGGGITMLGDNNLLMAYAHMGHDAKVGSNCVIANGVPLAGHVEVQDYATVGGLAGVAQFVRIGKHAYVAGMASVDRDIPPYTIAVGSRPCTIKGVNITGLRRRGFANETIFALIEAVKLWSDKERHKDKCLPEIVSRLGDIPEVMEFVKFISASEGGCIR